MDIKEDYFSFEGRIRRKDYWIRSILVGFGGGILAMVLMFSIAAISADLAMVGFALAGLVYLAVMVSAISLNIRRYHDIGKSGWMMLIVLVPLVGGILHLVWAGFTDSNPGPNQFGENPKGM